MYYPVQMPYILGKEFKKHIQYSEEIIPDLQSFALCLWEMTPITREAKTIENIVVTDGCIDLVVDYESRSIGFAGMTKTAFHFRINLPFRSFGIRFKPGAFAAMLGIPACEVMDSFLPIGTLDEDFDLDGFFALPYDEAKAFVKQYVFGLCRDKATGTFVALFDDLYADIPETVSGIYERLHFSPRQCQRIFLKHYGYSPQLALCVMRLQKSLGMLASGKASPREVLQTTHYYDQSHFIKDFKRHIGLTPYALIQAYVT